MEFFSFLQNIDTLAGVGSSVGVLALWVARIRDKRQGREKIEVLLVCNGQVAVLPLHLRRADVARAEVLGRMGMVPMREAGKRFSLDFLASEDFLEGINRVQDGKTSTLKILCEKEEFAQFNL